MCGYTEIKDQSQADRTKLTEVGQEANGTRESREKSSSSRWISGWMKYGDGEGEYAPFLTYLVSLALPLVLQIILSSSNGKTTYGFSPPSGFPS